MSYINRCFIAGKLTRDPKVKNFDNGGLLCTFSLEIKEKWSSKDGREGEIKQFFNICLQDEKAYEEIRQKLVPGNKFFIEGELKTRSYEDKDGQKKWVTEIVVNKYKGGHIIHVGEDIDDSSFVPPPYQEKPAQDNPYKKLTPKPKPFEDDDIPF